MIAPIQVDFSSIRRVIWIALALLVLFFLSTSAMTWVLLQRLTALDSTLSLMASPASLSYPYQTSPDMPSSDQSSRNRK